MSAVARHFADPENGLQRTLVFPIELFYSGFGINGATS
jgi:hypothetical protein